MAVQASSSLSLDLEAERALLKALALPEEEVVKPESALNIRLKRSSNAGHMFEATFRAVSERRSDRLDEVSVDNVKMDARWRKAEMDRAKMEAERDAMKGAIELQMEMVVNLVGMVGRCTVMIGEASRLLRSAVEEGRDGMEGTVRAMAASLKSVAEKNDEAFTAMVGHSIAGYKGDDRSGLVIDGFKGYSTLFSSRVSSGPILQPQPKPHSRRSSSYGGLTSPPRRTYRTPRKSLRSSISQPYRRVSDKERDKKSVQWRDEAGQGSLDDGGQQEHVDVLPLPSISITTVDSGVGTPTSETRTASIGGGSESEWEDEKTDDSLSMSFMSSTRSDVPLGPMNGPRGGAKRPRANRLDPTFLKSKGVSMLGSLAEGDENMSPVQRTAPLSDRNVNQLHDSENNNDMGRLHIPKSRERYGGSPSRRVPSTPRIAGSATKSGRRRLSNIGTLRAKRRSSMIPQPSPTGEDAHSPKGGGKVRYQRIPP